MDTNPDKGEVSRRRFGRAVLLGGAAAGGAAVLAPAEAAADAATTTPWKLTGNIIATDGSKYLGTKNNQPLILKTNGTERARIAKTGELLLKSSLAVNAPAADNAQVNVVTTNNSGSAVVGTAPNSISSALGAIGVHGVGTVGVQGNGEYMGVQGNSANYAVFGYTTPDTSGIGSYGRGAVGVKGRSYTGQAVLGDTDSGVGVKGESYGDGGSTMAIHGQGFGASNNGVVGQADNGASAYGVWGRSTSGYAGVFSGKVLVTGTLSKGGGSFQIDHPLDPENKYLFHSFVESPDMMNVYNGNVRTDGTGKARVRLPEYFEALNRDFRYQLTVIGQFAQAVVSSEIADRHFEIATDKPHVKVSWQVTGIRKDPWADANRIPEELDKPADERGTYLHPQAYGKPASADVQHSRIQAMRASALPRVPDPA